MAHRLAAFDIGQPSAVEVAGRAGWAARGVLYLLVAVLAARLTTTGGSQKEADQNGALATLAESGFGRVLLVVVVAGFAAFAVWRLWSAIRGDDEKTTRRLAWCGSAIVYANLFLLGIGVLRGHTKSGNKQALTARVLGWPGGPIIVGVAGLVILAVSANALRKGIKERFRHDIDEAGVPGGLLPVVKGVGVAGWLGRSLVIGIAGWFVLQAAWHRDANKPAGLDASLRSVATASWGTALLWVAAVGLAAYGLLCLATATWLEPPDT